MRGRARRPLFLCTATALATAALHAGACAPEDPGSPSAGAGDPLARVIYGGSANDDGLRALLAAAPEVNPAQAAIFDAPEDGALLPAGQPADIRWRIRDPLGWLPRPGRGEPPAQAPHWDLLGPVRAAHAHGAPMNGRGYLLVLSGPEGEVLARVFTTALSYTPDAATWDALSAEGSPITAVVTNAVFADGRVAPDGGPFAGEPITFTSGE